MKITWFGAMTFRIQIAGQILVTDANMAPDGVDASELVAGADRAIRLASPGIRSFDPAVLRPRRRTRLIDDEGPERVELFTLAMSGLVADSADEGTLIVANVEAAPQWGRWADGAVVVLAGMSGNSVESGSSLLAVARPRLVALAISDTKMEAAFDALAPKLGESSLVVLEPKLAVEV